MRFHVCKKTTVLPLLCLLGSAPLAMRAQDDGMNGPPKVLVIQREFLKPGKSGSAHAKTEGAFISAAKANKAPFHYFAMTSLSGPSRALFFSGYPSFAAWEAESKVVDKNAALSSALDRANLADGDLLSLTEQSVWTRNDEMSLRTHDLMGARYMEIEQFKLKPGHQKDWAEAVKMVKAAYEKGVPDANWVMWEQTYGSPGGGYLVMSSMKSLSEVDHNMMEGPKFVEAMGKDGMKKLEELSAAAIESEQTNLFAIDPKMSLPPEAWIQAEPDFWKAPAAPTKKKVEAKPAQ